MHTDTTPATTEQPAELPPYTGDETLCVKCSNPDAITRYRTACPRGTWEYNGRTERRGPLPERLERQCQRCDYQWDEALQPAPGVRPATAQEIAYALDQASRPYAPDLHPELTAHIAGRLLDMLHVLVRLDHPMWLPRPGRPLLTTPPAQAPAQPDPALTSPVPVPLHERPDNPAGPTAYTSTGEPQ